MRKGNLRQSIDISKAKNTFPLKGVLHPDNVSIDLDG